MNAKVQRWGNSLAIRVPAKLASALGLHAHSVVSLQIVDGQLVATPVAETGPTLDELLSAINESNLHPAMDEAEPMGREEW